MFNTLLNSFNINVSVATDKQFNDRQAARIRDIAEGNGELTSNYDEINTIFTCKKILCETLSKLPLNILKNGKKFKEHPYWNLVHNNPNSYQTTNIFVSTMTNHLITYGQAFARVIKTNIKKPVLQIIHPGYLTKYDLNEAGVLSFFFEIPQKNGQPIKLNVNNDDLIHPFMLSDNGITGLNPIAAIKRQISINYQAQNTIDNYYKNGLHSNKYVKSMTGVDIKAYNQGQTDWQAQNNGSQNAGSIPTVPYGSEIAELKLEFADAMLNDSIKFQSSQICALFGVPLFMLGLEEMKYKSIEDATLDFEIRTIQPLAKIFKEALSFALLTEQERSEGLTIEFDLKAMLGADSITRANYLKTMVSSGIMALNTAAQIEGYDEFENGSLHFMQSQNIPIELSMVDGKWSPVTNGTTINVGTDNKNNE